MFSDINLDLETFGKKKKKKKVPLNLDDLGDALPPSEPKSVAVEEVRELLGCFSLVNAEKMCSLM